MQDNLNDWFRALDENAVQAEIDGLREQMEGLVQEIAKREDLLDLKRRWLAGSDEPALVTAPAREAKSNADAPPKRGEKREAILAIMAENPRAWTPKDLSEALRERGLDPDRGTQVKNVMWHLAKDGKIVKLGDGEYRALSNVVALTARAREQEAMTV